MKRLALIFALTVAGCVVVAFVAYAVMRLTGSDALGVLIAATGGFAAHQIALVTYDEWTDD